jgi:hypothetical protein
MSSGQQSQGQGGLGRDKDKERDVTKNIGLPGQIGQTGLSGQMGGQYGQGLEKKQDLG